MAGPLHRDTVRKAGFSGRGWKDHQKTPSWWLAESLAQLKTANALVSGDSAGKKRANTHPKERKHSLYIGEALGRACRKKKTPSFL